jgi:hypothetical protein
MPFMDQLFRPDDNRTQSRICEFNEPNRELTLDELAIQWTYNIKSNHTLKGHCVGIPRCKRVIYDFTENTVFKEGSGTSSKFTLRLANQNIQYVTDSVGYDEQSFVGEVGGTLGLMLGLSFISIVDFFEYLLSGVAKFMDSRHSKKSNH